MVTGPLDKICGRSMKDNITDIKTKIKANIFLDCFENLPINGKTKEPTIGIKII